MSVAAFPARFTLFLHNMTDFLPCTLIYAFMIDNYRDYLRRVLCQQLQNGYFTEL